MVDLTAGVPALLGQRQLPLGGEAAGPAVSPVLGGFFNHGGGI